MSFTPSLFVAKDKTILTSISDRVSDLIAYAVNNPGNTTQMWPDTEISIPKIIYENNGELSAVMNKLESKFNNVLSIMFPGESIKVLITPEIINADENTYKLLLNPVDANNVSIIDGAVISIGSENNIILTFK